MTRTHVHVRLSKSKCGDQVYAANYMLWIKEAECSVVNHREQILRYEVVSFPSRQQQQCHDRASEPIGMWHSLSIVMWIRRSIDELGRHMAESDGEDFDDTSIPIRMAIDVKIILLS